MKIEFSFIKTQSQEKVQSGNLRAAIVDVIVSSRPNIMYKNVFTEDCSTLFVLLMIL